MRRNWKWLVGIVLIVTLCVAGATFAASASGEKSLAIEAKTLSLENEVQIKYAVSETGFTDAENIHLLVWMSAQTDYTYGTEDAVLDVLYTDTVGEKKCVIFAFDGFSAKQMTDTIYTRAYGSEDGDTCYSDVCEYSILQYALNQLTDPETDQKTKNALTAMLDYGAAAQLLFNYKTDTLANAGAFLVDVVNGTFDDGFNHKALFAYMTVKLVANPAPDGMAFVRWADKAGTTVGTTEELEITVTGQNTYTAVYTILSDESVGLEFTSNGDGTCYVSGIGTCEDTELVIPPTSPAGDTVTAIGVSAFKECYQIKAVEIPSGVTSIDKYAFSMCTGLTSVTIPEGVTSIDEKAFFMCDLTSVTIPSSVTSIGKYAFGNNHRMTSITIPYGVTNISGSAFDSCSGLTSVTIPASVASIGNGAFASCSSLTSITVQAGNTVYHSAGNCVIETASKTLICGCKASVIPTDGSVTFIGVEAFSGCSSLTNITIPSSVTSIGYCAFDGCRSLTDLTIPSSVTNIGDFAFSACSGLTNITIPDSVTSIGNHAFDSCPCVKTVGGIQYVGTWVVGCNFGVTTANIQEGTKAIATSAFSGYGSLTSITIPASVTSIGEYAFLYISNLTDIVFGGTQEQWNAISKGNGWNDETGSYTIHCTDGDIAK